MDRKKRTVKTRGIEVGGEEPIVCAPLVGQDAEELTKECERILPKRPDMIEWRADFFKHLADTKRTIEAANAIREAIGDVPLLFTIRSEREGGQPIALTDDEVAELIVNVCQSGRVDLVDYELRNNEQNTRAVFDAAKQNGVYVVMSYHNFDHTPEESSIIEKFREMERRGAHIAKVAVMPRDRKDVIVLFEATGKANEQLSIPIISISMGKQGSISRVLGWMFGSAVTFAVGDESSAPGQIPIEEMRATLRQIKKAVERYKASAPSSSPEA